MYQKKIVIGLPNGMHMRPMASFVNAAKKFKETNISIVNNSSNKEADAKTSPLKLLTLGLSKGITVTIKADGPNEKEAKEAVEHLVALMAELEKNEKEEKDKKND